MHTSSSSTPLKALTFDLDDTLWDNSGVMEATEHGHYAWLDKALLEELLPDNDLTDPLALGRFTERFPLSAYQARRREVAGREPLRRGDFTWVRRQSLLELLEQHGLPRQTAEYWAGAAMHRFMTLRHELTPYPEVDAMLAALSQRYRLGAITNGNVELARLPLARHFDVSIAAGEMLAPKPDPRPFLAALARLASRPSEALHVGDSWQHDVLPAQRLGMRVAWIDIDGEAPTRLPRQVYRLDHVRELPTLIEWMNGKN
ncbi:HAD family hydrolase [Pistricoccus aurantiacus]|uniref:HAD family hydrolase n=1 Tax=Pistricoccus aurantiacus TaxID=1883414 RepID=A0A5B8SRF9_9GAMM|nr:HAD family hydrolase [Pistricoccus aurantiacus]QEA38517.1 HAD family hydrolase [Pistricoccus aurantiacus]